MTSTSIYRIIKLGLVNFWRNRWLSFAATFIMTMTLLTISVFLIFNLVIKTTTEAIRNKINLSVYFEDNATDVQIRDLKFTLEQKYPNVQVIYVSKEDAYARWQEIQKNERIKQLVTKENNPLPRSLEVKTDKPEELSGIADYLTKNSSVIVSTDQSANNADTPIDTTQSSTKIIRKISYQENKLIVEKLINITNFSKKIGFVLSALFVLISILVILNTIKLTIFTRETEIEIMRLVGASDSFIKYPFLVEGALYGIIATIISLLLIYIGLRVVSPMITNYLGSVQLNLEGFFTGNLLWIVLLELLLAILISVTCSLISIRKNLKI